MSASSAPAPIKRLAWTKAVAVWTVQAKQSGRAVACSEYSVAKGTLSCTVYDPAVDPRASTFVVDGRHRVFGKVDLLRYDSFRAELGEPHPGCTYELRVYGLSLARPARYAVADVCVAGWVRRLPRVP